MCGKREIRAYLGRSGSLGDKEEPADREIGNYGEEGRAFVLPTEKHHGDIAGDGARFGDKEEPADREKGNYGEEGKLLSCRQKNTTGDIAGEGVVENEKKGVRFLCCLCDIFHDKPVAVWIFLWGCE
ncbi:hypothetical protein CEXT_492521 [Caerostris extrusa]|uniref:Uncharacterized protein n=1 Tax=Caerostris extrusa TaxID=172846 RepID=A0AAV4X8G2_CAEEX|nr:hypothetical protein CEXT_492521 [Caerostris extrusa]